MCEEGSELNGPQEPNAHPATPLAAALNLRAAVPAARPSYTHAQARAKRLQSGFPESLRSNLNECLFRKSIVGRPSSAIAKSLVSSGVAPSTAVSAVLMFGVKWEPTTRGMISQAP